MAFAMIENGINNGRAFMNLDPKMDEAFDMILLVIQSLYKLIAIFTPSYDYHIDEYCYGYTLGLEGSMMLARVANKWITPIDEEGNP